MTEGKKLVVIGSSFISMELVVAVGKRKLSSIDVIGMEEFPFELVLGKQVGAALKKVSPSLIAARFPPCSPLGQFHESNGVKFHMQTKINKIVPSASDSTKAGAVVITDSTGKDITLEADAVIMGVGVAPATEFLRASKGFEQAVDKTGAVAVDEFLKVKGLDGSVFALGMFAIAFLRVMHR